MSKITPGETFQTGVGFWFDFGLSSTRASSFVRTRTNNKNKWTSAIETDTTERSAIPYCTKPVPPFPPRILAKGGCQVAEFAELAFTELI